MQYKQDVFLVESKKKKNLWNYFFPNSSCIKKNSLDPNHFFSQAQLTFGSYTSYF